MDDATREVVRLWLRKADNDLKNIENNLSSAEVPTDTVCFHAQQAIEKLLKAVLVAYRRPVPKSHDLVRLLTECRDVVPELSAYEDAFDAISDYGVSTRYPDTFSEPSIEEARRAYGTASSIRTIICREVSR